MMNKELKLQVLFAGIAAGLFFGLVIGFSRSPVVGTAISSVIPIAVLAMNILNKGENTDISLLFSASLQFVGIFFIAALVGIGTGMFSKSKSSPTKALYDDLVGIGIKEKAAKKAVLDIIVKQKDIIPLSTSFGLLSADNGVANDTSSQDPSCEKHGKPPWDSKVLREMRMSEHLGWQQAAKIIMIIKTSESLDSNDMNEIQLHLFSLLCNPSK